MTFLGSYVSTSLDLCPTTFLVVLWGYTLFYWVKPYVHRTIRHLMYFLAQLLSVSLFVHYSWRFVLGFVTNVWLSAVDQLYYFSKDFSLSAPSLSSNYSLTVHSLFGFVIGCLFIGAFWFITRSYGGLAGKPSATTNSGSTVNSATLNDLTALITAALQPYNAQQSTPTPPPIFDISTITQQLASQLQPVIAKTICQSLAEIPALASLVTSVPSASFVANLVEGVQVEIENLCHSLDDVHHLVATSLNESSKPRSSSQSNESADIAPAAPAFQSGLSNSKLSEQKHVRWADIVSSDEEETTANTMVALIPKSANKGKRLNPTTPRQLVPRKSLPAELPDEFARLTEEELLEQHKERHMQRQAAKRPPYYLTDEEKKLSMDALHRAWKVERQRQNNEREALSRCDFEELGHLTAEQKELPRAAVRRIIRQRKNEVWANTMKARGIPVFQCDVCYELTTGNHRCMATKWTTDNSKNSAVTN